MPWALSGNGVRCLAQFVNVPQHRCNHTVYTRFVFKLYSHQHCTLVLFYFIFVLSMDESTQCNICTKTFRPRGFPNHRRACEARKIEKIKHQDRIDKAAEIDRLKKSKPQSHSMLRIRIDHILLSLSSDSADWRSFSRQALGKCRPPK